MFLPKETIDKLNKKFDPSLIKKRELNRGGKVLSYVPAHVILERLNDVFGHDVDSRIIYFTPENIATDEGNIVVIVELTVRHESTTIVKQGFGSAKVKKSKDGFVIDLGNDYKAASSDAIKKAASQLGIGLHLYDDSDVIEIDESTSDTASSTQVPVTTAKTPSKFIKKPPVTTNSNTIPNNTNPAPASEKSLNLMFKLLGEHSKTVADFGLQEGNLTQSEVSKVINQLLENQTSKPKEKVKS